MAVSREGPIIAYMRAVSEEGAASFYCLIPFSSNPYHPCQFQHQLWADGWREAEEQAPPTLPDLALPLSFSMR